MNYEWTKIWREDATLGIRLDSLRKTKKTSGRTVSLSEIQTGYSLNRLHVGLPADLGRYRYVKLLGRYNKNNTARN
jgi:hypothetical protein